MNTRILLAIFCFVLVHFNANAKGAWKLMTDGIGIDRIIKSLSVNEDGQVFAATAGKGMYRSSVDGTQWNQINTGIGNDTDIMSVLIYDLATIFAGSSRGIIYYSDDNGDSWNPVFESGESSDAVNSIASGLIGELYAGTANGNLYQSFNLGLNWNEIASEQIVTGIWSVGVSDFGEIFLATMGMGIYYSNDFGDTWILINEGLPEVGVLDVRTIEFDRMGTIYAGTSGYGVYRSLDFGLTWEEVNNGLENKTILSMAVDTNDNVFVGTNDGVYMSNDNGDNWLEINQGGLFDQKIYSLTVSSTNELFAGTETGNIYKWDGDFRTDFELILMIKPEAEITVKINDTVTYNIDVADLNGIPVEEAIVYISNLLDEGAQELTDNEGKATYSFVIPGGASPGGYEISFVAGKNEVGNSDVVNRYITIKEDPGNGGEWKEITNNLPDYMVFAIEFTANNDILVGLSGNGIYRSADQGETWIKSNSGLFANTTVVQFAKSPSGEIYGATSSFGLIKSTNNGNSWTTNLVGGTNILSVTASPDSEVFFLTNMGEIYKSTNGGTDWSEFNNGIDSDSITYIESGGNAYIYACNSTGAVFVSSINSPLWSEKTTGLEGTKVIVLNASADGKILAGTDDGVFASSDNGNSWYKSGTGLNGKSINLIEVVNNTYFAAPYLDGVYISKDQGNTWEEFNSGFEVLLIEKNIFSLRYHNSGNLFAGGFGSASGGGLFRRDVSATSVPENPLGFEELFIYPNPAKQVIMIDLNDTYSLPLKVSIRDMIGREMKENVDFKLTVGSNNMIIDCNGLNQGVYYIKLQNRDINYIGKFTINN